MRTDERDNFDRVDPNDPSDPSERALDELLKRASFPLPSIGSEQRLREQWIALSRKRPMGRVYRALAIAAAIVLIGGISLMTLLHKPNPQVAQDGPKMLTIAPNWREPTAAERWVALQAKNQPPKQKRVVESKRSDPSVDRLVRQLGDPLVDRRLQAARELAKVNQPQVVATLSSMVQRDVNRREALAALMLSSDPAARKALDDVARTCSACNAQIAALKHELRKSS